MCLLPSEPEPRRQMSDAWFSIWCVFSECIGRPTGLLLALRPTWNSSLIHETCTTVSSSTLYLVHYSFAIAREHNGSLAKSVSSTCPGTPSENHLSRETALFYFIFTIITPINNCYFNFRKVNWSLCNRYLLTHIITAYRTDLLINVVTYRLFLENIHALTHVQMYSHASPWPTAKAVPYGESCACHVRRSISDGR